MNLGETDEIIMGFFRDIPRLYAEDCKKYEEMLYMGKKSVKLEPHHIKAAETVLSKGDRVELIPVKDGVKVLRVRREAIKCGMKGQIG